MGGVLALLAALFGFGSCGAIAARAPVQEVRPPAHPRCEAYGAIPADVDGDGEADTAVVIRGADSATLVVCFGSGRVYERAVQAPNGAVLGAFDGEVDGDDELLVGRSRPDGMGYQVMRWTGTALVDVPLVLLDNGPDSRVSLTFGCDGNALVQVRVDWEQRRTTLESHTLRENVVTTSRRTRDVPPDAELQVYPRSLVEPCRSVLDGRHGS